jgi:hypothetical protein
MQIDEAGKREPCRFARRLGRPDRGNASAAQAHVEDAAAPRYGDVADGHFIRHRSLKVEIAAAQA